MDNRALAYAYCTSMMHERLLKRQSFLCIVLQEDICVAQVHSLPMHCPEPPLSPLLSPYMHTSDTFSSPALFEGVFGF